MFINVSSNDNIFLFLLLLFSKENSSSFIWFSNVFNNLSLSKYYALNGTIQASDSCSITISICKKGCDTCDETSYCLSYESGYYMFLTDTTLECVTDCKSTNNKFNIKDEFDCIEECPSNYNANRDNECVENTIPLTPPEGVKYYL